MTSLLSSPKTLGIDYGTKRIGLAISYGTLAEPFGIVANFSHPKNDDIVSLEALNRLLVIIREEKIEKIVVGMSENTMAEKIQAFVRVLKSKIQNLPFEFFDETLSSYEAKKRLSMKGIKNNKKNGEKDHYAAAVILENFLDLQH